MSFLEGLSLLLIYLRCTGYIRISWALVAIPVLVEWAVRNLRLAMRLDEIDRMISQHLCDDCEENGGEQ